MSYVDLTDIIKDQIPLSDRHVGYLVDLSTVQLEEGEETDTSWLHAVSVGTYKHPLYGTLDFTPERVMRFATNIKNKIRGIDPAIDYAHRSTEEAAGWVKDAEVRPNGLWVLVEWTKKAAEAIKNKEFRYFSPDFADEWTDAQGNKHKDVLFGGGLTNRPFLKDLIPINLSEVYGKEIQEDENMELTEQLREALGLSEDATEEDALSAIKKLSEAATPPPENDPPLDLPKELAESPIVKQLMDQVQELRTERTLSEAKRLTESWTINSQEKFALPPAVSEKVEALLVSASKDTAVKLSEIFEGILQAGLVELSETGNNRNKRHTNNDEESAAAEVASRTKKLMEENEGMTYADAYEEVSRDEELFERYRRESLAGIAVDKEGDE